MKSQTSVGLGSRARGWVARRASQIIADRYDTIVGALGTAQQVRELLDEVQSAAWHLSGLPSGRDLNRLFRRATSIRRKLLELERALTRLERIVDASDAEQAPLKAASGAAQRPDGDR